MSPTNYWSGRVAATRKPLQQYVTDDHIVFRITLLRYSISWPSEITGQALRCDYASVDADWTVACRRELEQSAVDLLSNSAARVFDFFNHRMCEWVSSTARTRRRLFTDAVRLAGPVRLDRWRWSINALVMERPASRAPSLLLKHWFAVVSRVEWMNEWMNEWIWFKWRYHRNCCSGTERSWTTTRG